MPAMRCPMCTALASPAHKPFCSKRCADRDLGQWLGGGYAIPGQPADSADLVPSGAQRDGGLGSDDG